MNLSMIAYIVGCVLEIEAALMLLPAGIGLLHGEQTGWAFLAVAVGAALVGLIVVLRRPKNTSFFAREGLVATALSWLAEYWPNQLENELLTSSYSESVTPERSSTILNCCQPYIAR